MGGDLRLFPETVPWFHVILEDVLGQVIPASRMLGVQRGLWGQECFGAVPKALLWMSPVFFLIVVCNWSNHGP